MSGFSSDIGVIVYMFGFFVNKGANEMADKIEDKPKFRHLIWGTLIVLGVIMPVAWQLKDILKILVLHQG